MKILRNRAVSAFLAFIMVMTMVVEILPPIEVSAAASVPTVETLECIESTPSSVVIRGRLTANGGDTITSYGFGYMINNSGTWNWDISYSGSLEKNKIIEYKITGLESGDVVLYYFYAINSVGESSPTNQTARTTQYFDINSPTDNKEYKIGDDVIVSWSRGTTCDYYEFIVRELEGEPRYNIESDEKGRNVIKDEVPETSKSYVSYTFSTEDFLPLTWYKIYIKGYWDNGNVAYEANGVYIYMVNEDQETLSAGFGDYDGSKTVEISGDGYKESTNVAQIYIDASTNWTASVDEDWVTLSRYKGTSSNINTLVYAEHNDTLKERRAYITIVCGDLEVELCIIQEGRELTILEKCENDANELEIIYASGEDEDCVTRNITLPTGGLTYGSSVKWKSSNSSIISNDGQVNRPEKDTQIVLTATVSIDTISCSKEFYVTVVGRGSEKDLISINPDWDSITAGVSGGIGTTFTVTSSDKWYVDADVNWISFNRESGNSGSSFTPTIAANTNAYREGIITVTCGDASIEICVQQEGTTTKPEKVPCVTSLTVSPTEGTLKTTYTFTAKAENTDTVVFYVSGYKIGEVTSTNVTFECTYNKFTNGGDRVVYAYPCDEYGNEIKTGGSYQTEEFTITVGGTLSPVEISTDSYQNIDVNTSFTVEWADTAAVPNDVSYNIYVWYDSKQVGDVMNTSSHSKTISSSYFTKEGRYTIGIYAISDTWAASSGVSIAVNVTVNTPYIENFAISPNTVSLGGTVGLSGMVYGNGSDIAEIIIKITNNSDGTGGVYKTLYPNSYTLNLADTPAINTSDAIFTIPGTYSVKLYALNEGAVKEVLLGQRTLQVVSDSKITLNTPVLGGASTISYGDDYAVSWNYDGSVDYYLIGISSLTYSKTVDASNSSYTIPFSVFKQYLGSSGSNFTVYVTAMSNSDTYLPSAKESKTVYVSGDASEKAVIKSVTLPGRDHNEVTAGETVTFKVVTSTDVEAIRMKDGAGTFIVNTWNSGYTDSGSNRTWTVKQKVSYAGGSDVDYVNRSLTFYSMIGNTEYNKCNVTFICVKDAVVGAFDITKPVNGSEQQPEKSLTITWTTPDTGVDYYVVDITHNGVRIDEDVFPHEVRNGNSYTLDGSYLIRDNNAWNVQVTGCKAGMADTSDSVRFVLKCQHEKLGTAVERYLSYTNTGSSSTHSVKTEKTYPCLECGMTNAKTESGTKAVNHNYITLDEGGKVCNQCWYVNSNGSYDVQYDMSLVTTNSNGRENVYANVGADGNPVNVQSNRYVEVGDSITVWGVLGNSYLIEYPTSSGTHKGFVRESVIFANHKQSDGVSQTRTYNQIVVDKFVEQYYDNDYSYSTQPAKSEFLVSQMVADEQSATNGWLFGYVASNSWTDNIKLIVSNFSKSALGTDDYYTQSELVRPLITSIITSIPSDDEIMEDLAGVENGIEEADKIKNYLEKASKQIIESNTLLDQIASADQIIYANYCELSSQKIFDKKILKDVISNEWIVERIDDFTGATYDYLSSGFLEYVTYQKIQLAADLQYFDLLLEFFDDNESREVINEMRENYFNESFGLLAFSLRFLYEQSNDAIIKAVAEGFLKCAAKFYNDLMHALYGSKFNPVSLVLKKVNTVDFIRGVLANISGLESYSKNSANLVLFHYINEAIRGELIYSVYNYHKGDNSAVMADRIIALYNLSRGCQIYMNQCALEVTDSDSVKVILRGEINHLKTTNIDNWSINPYAAKTSIEKPDVNQLNTSKYGYYYKILLEGYNNINNDGLLGEWDELSQYEKYLISEEAYELFEFAKSDVSELYFMNIGKLYKTYDSKQWYQNPYNELCVLFVNDDGMGLLLRYYDDSPDSKSHKAFSVMSREETDNLLNSGNKLPTQYFFVNRYYYTYGGYQTSYDLITNDDKGYRSVLFETTQNKNMEVIITVAEKYFKLEIDSTTYEAILEKTTSYKYYAGGAKGIAEWDSIISDIFGVWIWTTPSVDYIAEEFNKHAKKTNNPKIAVNVVKTSWDFDLN